MTNFWIFKMAWRDSRASRRKLLLYMTSITAGIAAMVAITAFRADLHRAVNTQAKELLSADLVVSRNDTLQAAVLQWLDETAAEISETAEFSSMVLFPASGYTRLSQIVASDNRFPLYGSLKTTPAAAADAFYDAGGVLVEETIMQQLELSAGDSVKIGEKTFVITGALQELPGQPLAASFAGPRIVMPRAGLSETGLTGMGSRINYKTYVRYKENINPAPAAEQLTELNKEHDFNFTDVEKRKKEIGSAADNLVDFMNLIGFIALLLGGIGIASSVFIYIRGKLNTVALLRCTGVSSAQATGIFLIQTFGMGLAGSAAGAAAGSAVQFYLPLLVSDFLPVAVETRISATAIAAGVLTGSLTSVVFSLFPLMAVRKITPLYTLRQADASIVSLTGKWNLGMLSAVISVFITVYAWFMLHSLKAAVFFTAGLLVCLLLLAAISKLVSKTAASVIAYFKSYEWRQGLANLYRPDNQTIFLMLTLGLGITLISALYLTQDILLQKLRFENSREMPDLALFDIQTDQNDGVNELIKNHGFSIIQNVPIVTMRLESIRGKPVPAILADSSRTARRWALTREYRSTYRDSLLASEKLISGKFIARAGDFSQPVPVTVDAGLMQDLDIQQGDTLVWDVQGFPVTSYISGIRKVEWDTPQPNFFVVFPAGILEQAPQFFATTLHAADKNAGFALQRDLVLAYPNISAIDVGQVLDTVRLFTDKIAYVIQFIGFFSIITGLIVLAGSASAGRHHRLREASLLRTLGATRKQVVKIQITEYLLLGLMAALSGLLLSLGAGFFISFFYLEISFTPNLFILIAEMLVLMLLVMITGLFYTTGIHNKPPLEVLRTVLNING